MAVVVSRKISKSAVIRNRIRRRIFEAVRNHQPHLKGGHDLVFIALNKDLATIESANLAKDVEMVLKRAHIWHGSVAKQIDA